MAKVKDNVRVMIVRNEELKPIDKVYCSIQVGVGSEDDPEHFEGLAHLLEHVIAVTSSKNQYDLQYDCVTNNFETTFSFTAAVNYYQETIAAWTKTMFSNDPIDNDIMIRERKLVDNEYQEKRNRLFFTADRTNLILKQKDDITLAPFGWGNLKTLVANENDLMRELMSFRKRYSQRPLKVCVYSGHEIQMVFLTRLLDDLIPKKQQEEAEAPNWMGRLKSVDAPSLVLLQSANDLTQLDIIYPFRKKLSVSEEDTFEIVGDLINGKFAGQLGHVLFEKKLASACMGKAYLGINSFVVTIRLTKDGLKHIRQVTSMVHDYFQFLHNNWQKIDMEPLIKSNWETINAQSGLAYATSIARCLGRVSESFDEKDLFRPLLDEGKQLISEQILNNKSIRHTIAARNFEEVCGTLAGQVEEGNTEVESITGTQFQFLETRLFPAHNNFDNFTLPQLNAQPDIVGDKEYLVLYITKASDEAFMALYAHYLRMKTEHLVAGHKLKKDGKKYGVTRWPSGRISVLLNSEDYNKYIHHPEKIDFDYCKQSLMKEYSVTMTNSMDFAKSLMATALQNFTSNIKRDSIPLQYNVLKGMDYGMYNNHFQQFDIQKEIKYKKRYYITQDPKKFKIKSINDDESTTVTLVFLKQPKTTDASDLADWENNVQHLVYYFHTELIHKLFPSLYTCTWEYATYGAAKGILLILKSVEGKPDQTGEKILELLEHPMNEKVETKFGANTEVSELWKNMRKLQIIIQIVGHEKGVYPSGSFQKNFETWFENHEPVFKDINDISKKLQTKHAK
ncbi:hypothetical protein HA402_001196 [Bradysia odoriphaga]|nr:hypothetical protein HA402_001196 [Bradysia odoriphaga]